jgi:hypothetical protein
MLFSVGLRTSHSFRYALFLSEALPQYLASQLEMLLTFDLSPYFARPARHHQANGAIAPCSIRTRPIDQGRQVALQLGMLESFASPHINYTANLLCRIVSNGNIG